MSELGIVLPLKAVTVRREAAGGLEDLPGWANTVVGDLLSELHRLDERVAAYDAHIATIAREDDRARALMRLSGVGPTTATAILAMIGNGHEFRCGRQFAAWPGLTPGQYSSGGKPRLGRITKAGDAYLRTMLILGARAVLAAAKRKTDAVSRWAIALEARRGYWKAVVAIAAKNARMAWAMLARGEAFKVPGEVLGVAPMGVTSPNRGSPLPRTPSPNNVANERLCLLFRCSVVPFFPKHDVAIYNKLVGGRREARLTGTSPRTGIDG